MTPKPPSVVRLSVRVTPRASQNALIGWDDQGVLRVRLTAPPVEGEANLALVQWLARMLGVPRSAVRIARGESGRLKHIEITGVDRATIEKKIEEGMT